MTLDCFARIFRAGRNETARRRQPRRDYCFVELQKRNQNETHRRRTPNIYRRSSRATCSTILRNSLKRSSSLELSSGRLALKTQSYRWLRAFNSVALRRKTSRSRRRARLRSTDFPIALVEAVTPRRCCRKSFLRKKAAIRRPS